MKKYYEEDVLVQKVQSGEMTTLDYVTHHSKEWDEEYAEYCEEKSIDVLNEESAVAFLQYKDQLLTKAIEEGNI